MSAPTIDVLDAQQFGLPRTGAIYLIHGSQLALIESGTATAAERTLQQLRASGGTAVSPAFIFLTHIHLDHAGGAGHLARAFPDAKIVVHERGARHLANPSQLIEGVRCAAPDLFPRYGEPLPIPEQQLLPVTGGEVFDLGHEIQLEVIATPGHASHHVCYYERTSRTLFTGDAAGNWNNPADVPLTPPPRFDLARGLQTLATLKRLAPTYLAFTHFGMTDDALSHLNDYERRLIEWFDDIRTLRTSLASDDIVKQILNRPRYAGLKEAERSVVAMCVRGAILSIEAGSA